MRALVDIDESQILELDRLARKQKQSRAALIREAVADYLGKQAQETTESAFGLWGKRKVDGLAYQEKIRGEW
ncbi:Ribbon-helix-helix protein, copG family [Mesorhizobium albiziae]|uniref:Ribbon-helix-helix protein, copG family n=1 Tax=Neomesorhizobium albiziae TaxID=335020 RepID=A0A1I4BHY0_9HYPH|nr:CopG family transcriptional regulator [Mesorhizobium albiziae]GLS29858.1 CopG family transcriptional regulator [Mesorhizobium albiziae]SFK67591.1 Ribbon-helix-helix protein, copG family [Mesorhizobium albiziae]